MKTTLAVLTVVLGVTMPATTNAQQTQAPSPAADVGATCPLGRVAAVRGADAVAREGGGFLAARDHGVHGAVDLAGLPGEAVFAVASGTAVVASRDDWGALGRTVVIDHQDGGYTVYGHLRTVEVDPNSEIEAGQMIGTVGYSGDAGKLQEKNLPPYLHFGYFRAVSGRADDIAASLEHLKLYGDDGVEPGPAGDLPVGIDDPALAVSSVTCWDAAVPAVADTKP
jgi:murein DD-endopeptidase MepM/ murein hydrolase activator NlpD